MAEYTNQGNSHLLELNDEEFSKLRMLLSLNSTYSVIDTYPIYESLIDLSAENTQVELTKLFSEMEAKAKLKVSIADESFPLILIENR